jgi:hypothetical protein
MRLIKRPEDYPNDLDYHYRLTLAFHDNVALGVYLGLLGGVGVVLAAARYYQFI